MSAGISQHYDLRVVRITLAVIGEYHVRLVFSIIGWLPLGLRLSCTNLRWSGPLYTREAPDPSSAVMRAHQCCLFSIEPRV